MKKFVFLTLLTISFCFGYSQIPIAEIQANHSAYLGQYVWIEGVITIGAGRLYNISGTPYLKAYIMDESGRGLQIFHSVLSSNHLTDIVRGHKILMYGQIIEFQNNLEITPETYSITGTGYDLEAFTVPMSIIHALNWQENEGTFINTIGVVLSVSTPNNIGYEVIIEDEVTGLDIRIWNYLTNDILPVSWQTGSTVSIKGALGVYNNASNIYPGYPEDVSIVTGFGNDLEQNSFHPIISPNPVKDQSMILFESYPDIKPSGIVVFDAIGNEMSVDYQIHHNGIQISRSGLKSGIYLIVFPGKRHSTLKMIVE